MAPTPRPCAHCGVARAALRRPRCGTLLCQACFFAAFEDEVHATLVHDAMLRRGDVVACGASGGKDSTVLMHVLHTLNARHDYGVRLVLVSIDEGIAGYRDDSLRTVQRNAVCYGLPLHVLSYRDVYGWTMDEVVRAAGLRNSCTFCGVLRRQALERAARHVGAHVMATGHNADDTAETLLMNVLRGDVPRLARSSNNNNDDNNDDANNGGGDRVAVLRRLKPLRRAYQKEIVMYAHFKQLDYFTTECTYAAEAFRGIVRGLLKELEVLQPRCIAAAVQSSDTMRLDDGASRNDACGSGSGNMRARAQTLTTCMRCGHATSQKRCRACVLLDALDKGTSTDALYRNDGHSHDKDNDENDAAAK